MLVEAAKSRELDAAVVDELDNILVSQLVEPDAGVVDEVGEVEVHRLGTSS